MFYSVLALGACQRPLIRFILATAQRVAGPPATALLRRLMFRELHLFDATDVAGSQQYLTVVAEAATAAVPAL